MSKNSRFRGRLELQHGKQAETLFQSTAGLFSYLLINVKEFELEGVSVNDMENLKYSLLSREKLMQSNQLHLSQKEKLFLNFFLFSSSLNQTLHILKKR